MSLGRKSPLGPPFAKGGKTERESGSPPFLEGELEGDFLFGPPSERIGSGGLRRSLRRLGASSLAFGGAAWLLLVLLAAARAQLESPAPTSMLRDRAGRFLGVSVAGDAEEGYWPLPAVPTRVAAAILAIEDRRFESHRGVDARALVRAAVQNARTGRRVSGASTVAMQVARMQRPGARTYGRKAVEALTALMLTARYGRQAMLRHYLTLVPYGNGFRGIAYAARRYFDKPVADLSWAETAFLSAIPQSPARMNPYNPEGRARAARRGQRILDQLHTDGMLSDVELAAAEADLAGLRIPARDRRPENALHAVLRLERHLERDGDRFEAAKQLIVDTTLDLTLQDEVAWRAGRWLETLRPRGAGNLAVMVVERETWAVRAAIASSGYFDATGAGAIDYLQVPRSSGSTLKPFLYGAALERGLITPTTVLDDLGRGVGGIVNADGRFLGPLLPAVALANSRNVPAADLLARLGIDEGYSTLGALGLHDGSGTARRYGLGLAIGSMPVTLERLVEAYTALAGDGRRHALRWLAHAPVVAPRRVLSEATARQISRDLADPQARLPSFPRMGWAEFPFAVAVKTGTSSRFRDAWTVAYSSRWLVGVWIGRPDAQPMAELSGYRAAAPLASEVMRLLHRDQTDGLEDLGFPPPRGHVGVRVCPLSGRLASPSCDRATVVHLAPAAKPTETCRVHRRIAIDARNGLLATTTTPPSARRVRSFTVLPPRYAAWAAGAGLPRPPRLPSLLGEGAQTKAVSTQANTTARFGMESRVQRIEITEPRQGVHLLIDPETPPSLATVALRATVDPPVEQLVWYVDGQPFATVDHPFTARWPLAPGEHTIEARLPFGGSRSGRVRVLVE